MLIGADKVKSVEQSRVSSDTDRFFYSHDINVDLPVLQ